MNPVWYPTIVSSLISLLTAASIWGSLRRAVKEHERRLNGLDERHQLLDERTVEHGEHIAYLTAHIESYPLPSKPNGGLRS